MEICFKRKFKIRTQPILLTFVQQIMWALPWSSCRNGMAVSSILEELLLADDYQGGIWSNDLCKLKLIDSVSTWDFSLFDIIYLSMWYFDIMDDTYWHSSAVFLPTSLQWKNFPLNNWTPTTANMNYEILQNIFE